MVNTKDSEAFVTITNRDIYDKIEQMHDDIKQTNGQVKTHKKLINALLVWLGILTAAILRFFTK